MTRRRSVRHLIKGLGPGGAERLLLNQVRAEQGTIDHEVVFRVAEKTHLVADLEAAGARVTRLPGGSPSWVLALRRELRGRPTEILHCHSPALASVARLVARTLPASARPVVVGTEHNRWPRHHRLTRLANRLTIRLEAATIAVSDDVASTIRGARPDQIRTIEHGIDLAAVQAAADRDAARAELGAGPDDLVVMCVANLRREKALDDLIEAARLALETEPSLRFVLVGQGPLAAEVDTWIAEAGIRERFTATGYRTDVPRLLSAADLFSLSSRHEGLPVAIMEALAHGIPVVATDAGGVADAVADAGRIVPVGATSALAAGYVALATDPDERAGLADLARRRAEHFSVERAVAEIGEIYDTVTSEGAGAGSSNMS